MGDIYTSRLAIKSFLINIKGLLNNLRGPTKIYIYVL